MKKRQWKLILEKAREVKRRRESGEGTSSTTEIEVRMERGGTDDKPGWLAGLLAMPGTALDTDEAAVDPTFAVDSSMKSDADHIMKNSVMIGFHTLTGMIEFLLAFSCAFS